MDLIRVTLATAFLVVGVLLFLCCIAFVVLLWKASQSTQPREGRSFEKRFLVFNLGWAICAGIWTLLQALLAFQVIPQRAILSVQIVGGVFLFVGALLMITLFIQAIRNRKALRRNPL